MNNKINAYIGFALRSRGITLGVNAIEAMRNRVYLYLLCSSAGKNTLKQAKTLANKANCRIVIIKNILLQDIVGKENCKLGAITNKDLAKAILDNLDDNFCLFEEDSLIE